LERLKKASGELADREAQSRHQALHDALSGLPNRHSFVERLQESLDGLVQTRNNGRVVVAYVDVDRFKDVNDEHGHDRGDAVLKDAAYILRKHLRSFELIYRLGGEEFLIVLPGVAVDEGRAIAERVRAGIEDARPAGLGVTASFGVAGSDGGAAVFEPLFAAADEALYEAKRTGRNRVVAAGYDEPLPLAA